MSESYSAAMLSHHIVGYKGEKRKILLVDDNEKNRAVLKDMLLPLGFEIAEAINGQDALAKSTIFYPALIFMDLVMPVMDGVEATRQIRQISALEGIIVIGISASTLEAKRQMSLQAGCNDFLAKPIHIDELLECLQTHLRLSGCMRNHLRPMPGNSQRLKHSRWLFLRKRIWKPCWNLPKLVTLQVFNSRSKTSIRSINNLLLL